MRRLISTICIAVMAACTASGPAIPFSEDAPIEIMVLGTYHFANPGTDVHNVEVESVLTEEKQAELQALAEALSAFRPTKVAIEIEADAPSYEDTSFKEFDADALRTKANERIQIGYRLAAYLGHANVYGIDEQPGEGEPDYFPYGKLSDHVAATDQQEAFDAMNADVGKMVSDFGALQAERSIPEMLIELNTGPMSSADYYFNLLNYDEGETQPAAELNAYWFMRNAKIFSKLLDIAEPGDRIIVVYGAGHKYWLDHLADSMPGVLSASPVPYLEAAASK